MIAPSTPTSEHRARPRTSPESPTDIAPADSEITIRLSPVSSPSVLRAESSTLCGRDKLASWSYYAIAIVALIIVIVIAFAQLNPWHSLSVKV